MVCRPRLRQGLVQGRVDVGGEVTDLPAEIQDGGQGEPGQDGGILLHLGQGGQGCRSSCAVSSVAHPYHEGATAPALMEVVLFRTPWR